MAQADPDYELTITTRQGHPDFLDLPWEHLLETWDEITPRLIRVERGLSRHVVRMVEYGEAVYALKETEYRLAQREYDMLRRLEEDRMPAVRAVGTVDGRVDSEGQPLPAVLITRYLDYALPYQYLFRTTSTEILRDRLLDAAVVLMTRLHLEGFFWGDASLANVLFRRDAGALMAYLVDAETAEWPGSLSDARREYDLELASINIAGGLFDAIAEGLLDESTDPAETVNDLVSRYQRLWDALTREDEIDAGERWRIDRRIDELNELGFDVDQLSVVQSADRSRLRIRPMVVEEGHAHLRLRRLTGLEAQENQARVLLNAIDAYGAHLERAADAKLPEAIKAYRWLSERYEPVIEAIPGELRDRFDDAQLIFEFLQHRRKLSEEAARDVENPEAIASFTSEILTELPGERQLLAEEISEAPRE
jgi:hypothetical protein